MSRQRVEASVNVDARAIEEMRAALPDGCAERWALDYVLADDLATKLAPAAPPRDFIENLPAIRVPSPGRPASLDVVDRSPKTSRSLAEPAMRARALSTFLHHELQAAELMCWAILAFPNSPRPLKNGLIGICLDEIRHMNMYAEHIDRLGFRYGNWPVVDWFWHRIPQSESIIDYVASMGIGFEGGNLDHALRFAERFREAGDVEGAAIQDRVREEEIPHVRFAIHWYRELRGDLEFDGWRARLPQPLSPLVMKGHALNVGDRERAGYDAAFLERLAAWTADSPGR
jgi:uncharacterized ferritin-like protein (DUF455 family)